MSVFLKKKESFLHEIFSKEVREPCVKAGGDTIRWFVGRRTANTRVFDISLQPYTQVLLFSREYFVYIGNRSPCLHGQRSACIEFWVCCFVLQVRSGRSATYSCPHISVFLA